MRNEASRKGPYVLEFQHRPPAKNSHTQSLPHAFPAPASATRHDVWCRYALDRRFIVSSVPRLGGPPDWDTIRRRALRRYVWLYGLRGRKRNTPHRPTRGSGTGIVDPLRVDSSIRKPPHPHTHHRNQSTSCCIASVVANKTTPTPPNTHTQTPHPCCSQACCQNIHS